MSQELSLDQQDVELQSRVRFAFAGEQRDGFQGIRLRVQRRVALLWGEVPSHFIRQMAMQLAGRVPGIRSVADNMTVIGQAASR